ncbi:MAG: histidine decarboxylase [Pirellulales bacterium]|nr:histidine decarboxylase [Pirellulales bacterium]
MGTLSAADRQRLDELNARLKELNGTFIGYPCSGVFDYAPLFHFLRYPFNNVGDPFVTSNYQLNTHEFEREVVEIFARLTRAPEDASWGYVTGGGTEGNMYGIFLGRELHPEGVVYYSEDTHYSVNKILRCLHVRNIMIKSDPDGRIDLEDLRETIRIHRDVPPIIFANVGTTVKGAVDDLPGIKKILHDLAISQYYLHVDAALSGMILPFVEHPQPWNFADGAHSISISGHKMIGAPIPCGVVLAKKKNVDRIARQIEYVGTLDTTIPGSRNAFSPLMLWYAFHTVGEEGLRRSVRRCLETADYAIARFAAIGRAAWRHPNSVTVVFDRPSQNIVRKWQLAVLHGAAHIITMPHVSREQIDRFVADMAEDESPAANGELSPEGETIP